MKICLTRTDLTSISGARAPFVMKQKLYQETTTPPEHPLSHLNLLDVHSLEPSSQYWLMAPTVNQRSRTVKRERAPMAQTPPLQHLRQVPLHAMPPHDQASFLLTTISSLTRAISRCRGLGHSRSFFETLSQTPSAAAKAEVS